jgi:hypothetical protein
MQWNGYQRNRVKVWMGSSWLSPVVGIFESVEAIVSINDGNYLMRKRDVRSVSWQS